MAALAAEEAVGFIGMSAGRAQELQFAPALLTELGPFFILRQALQTFHLSSPLLALWMRSSEWWGFKVLLPDIDR